MFRQTKILILDDDSDALKLMKMHLGNEDYEVQPFSSAREALESVKNEDYDTLLVDYQMPEMSGLEFNQKVKDMGKDVPLILFTAYGTISHAVEAMKEGIFHYLSKPVNYDELKFVLKNSVKFHLLQSSHKKLEREVQKLYSFHGFIGKSKSMRKIFHQMEAAAKADMPVFIQGEKGTGKETIAKIIHCCSTRKDAPFVSLDCSAISKHFLFRELFGSEEEGVVTKGRVDEAEGGALYLREIHCLPTEAQSELLHYLKEKEFTRQGGKKSNSFRVRVMASALEDAEMLADKKKLQPALLEALSAMFIALPPLRERREDIPLLAEHFLKMYSEKYKREIGCVGSSLYAKLLSHPFPENVTELYRFIERGCIVCESHCLELDHIPELLADREQEEGSAAPQPFLKEKEKTIEKFEREYFITLMMAAKGRVGEASKISGIAERNIYEKLRRYRLKKENFKTARSEK